MLLAVDSYRVVLQRGAVMASFDETCASCILTSAMLKPAEGGMLLCKCKLCKRM